VLYAHRFKAALQKDDALGC